MSPNEAAELLGVSPSATPDDVQRAYEVRLAESWSDVQRQDALAAARDALLAASAWQPPHSTTQPTVPVSPQTSGYPPAPSGYPAQPPGYPPQPGFGPPQPGYAPQPPYPGADSGPWYPAAPPRRRLSTGAIVGITLGSIAAGLVLLFVALGVIFAVAHSTSRLAGGTASTAAPFDSPSPSPTQGGGDSSTVDDYDVDGVHVHSVDGWTFELTSGQTCTGATITAGFTDTPDGDDLGRWSTTVDLVAGEPYTFTIPETASTHQYAGIDAVDCGQA